MDVETVAKDRGTILAEERTNLAVERSVMAAERTLMAWIRTAISMIGFGFTIYKFFQYKAEDLAAGVVRRPNGAAKPGVELDCGGNFGAYCRGLAAQKFSEADGTFSPEGNSFRLFRGCHGGHPDRHRHLLWCSPPQRPVLAIAICSLAILMSIAGLPIWRPTSERWHDHNIARRP